MATNFGRFLILFDLRMCDCGLIRSSQLSSYVYRPRAISFISLKFKWISKDRRNDQRCPISAQSYGKFHFFAKIPCKSVISLIDSAAGNFVFCLFYQKIAKNKWKKILWSNGTGCWQYVFAMRGKCALGLERRGLSKPLVIGIHFFVRNSFRFLLLFSSLNYFWAMETHRWYLGVRWKWLMSVIRLFWRRRRKKKFRFFSLFLFSFVHSSMHAPSSTWPSRAKKPKFPKIEFRCVCCRAPTPRQWLSFRFRVLP